MKRIISLILSLCLLAACGLAGAESKVPEGKPWINSNIQDNIRGSLLAERPAPEYSFDLYANYDIYRKSLETGTAAYSLKDAELVSQVQVLDLCRNLPAEGAEDEILKILYGLFMDTEKRDADGLAPLMARVDRIRAAATVDDLLALMQEEGFLLGDPFFTISVRASALDPSRVIVQPNAQMLLEIKPLDHEPGPGEFMEAEKETDIPKAMLVRMQYTEEEAAALVERMKAFDDYIELDAVEWEEGPLMTLEQVKERSLPLYAQIVGRGMVKEGAVYEISTPSDITRVDHFFTEENLDLLKAIAALSMYKAAASYLDVETWKSDGYWHEDDGLDKNLYELLFDTCRIVGDQAYLNHFCPVENREAVVALFGEYKEAMRDRILRNDWMDETTKQKSLEKLDLIVVADFTAPGGTVDCEPLLAELKSCSTLLDAFDLCQRFMRKFIMRYAGEPNVRGNRYLPDGVQLMTSNGQYEPLFNMVFIGAPALNMPMFNTTSRATLLGSTGHHIAHELSHAFDTNGALLDATGQAPLYTEEIAKIFGEKVDVIKNKMNLIELLDGVMLNGEVKISELVADLTGVSLSLDLAKKSEDFDYATFFTTYANFFYASMPDRELVIHDYLSGNPHPAPYVRVNYVVAQFDEFYEAFPSVTEGTPMYVAPEDRVLIW